MWFSSILLCIAAGADDIDVAEIAVKLKKRSATVRTVAYEAELEIRPSEKFVNEYAAERNVAVDEVRRNLSSRRTYRIIERTDGAFLVEIQTVDSDGEATGDELIAFDGSQHWRVTRNSANGDRAPEVVVGEDVEARYNGVLPHRAAIDLVRPTAFSSLLGDAIADSENKALLAIEESDEWRCAKIQFEEDQPGRQRATVWLDLDRGFVLRKMRREFFVRDQWRPAEELVSTAVDNATIRTADGNRTALWYPRRVEVNVFNGRGEVTSREIAFFSRLNLNPSVTAADFRPKLQAGAAIRDAASGKTRTHRGKPSSVRTESQEPAAAQPHEKFDKETAVDELPPAEAPGGLGDYIAPGLAVIGLVAIIAAIAYRTRIGADPSSR